MKPYVPTITDEWIRKLGPCLSALEWASGERDTMKLLRKLITEKRYEWANWFIVRVMEKRDCVTYAIYAAKQVAPLWAKKHPAEYKIWNTWANSRNHAANRAAAAANRAAAAGWADAAASKAGLQLKILRYGMRLLRI